MAYHYPMERVLYNLHHQLCTFALQKTTKKGRRLAERTLVFILVGGFSVTLLCTVSFVHRDTTTLKGRPLDSIPRSCFASIRGFSPFADITHVSLLEEESTQSSFAYFVQEEAQTNEDTNVERVLMDSTVPTSFDQCKEEEKEDDDDDDNAVLLHVQQGSTCTSSSSSKMIFPQQHSQQNQQHPQQHSQLHHHHRVMIWFSYSQVEGYLYLIPELCTKHNISVQYVMVSRHDIHCLGGPILQTIVSHLTGYDVVMMNWIIGYYNSTGYIYNPRTKRLFDLSQYGPSPSTSSSSSTTTTPTTSMNPIIHRKVSSNNNKLTMDQNGGSSYSTTTIVNRTTITTNDTDPKQQNQQQQQWKSLRWYQQVISKSAVVLKTSFLFFIVTTLVSFILRETQERMLEFTHQLQAHVRQQRPVTHLVTTHVIENLVFVPIMVGMIFFLIEFYRGDKVIAFMVLSIVWICEAFSVISLRSSEGMHFFPRIFFLEFSIFHFYLFSFPFGFAYIGLASTAVCMIHSMLFFWHRYELPAVALGHVTLERPRLGSVHSPGSEISGASTTTTTPRENDHRDYIPPPPVPSLAPRQSLLSSQVHPSNPTLHRQPSGGSTLGRQSRQSSSTVLFRAGDDGDESSYMFFMDGEVVMHQNNSNHHIPNDRRSPSPFMPMDSDAENSVLSNSSHHRRHPNNHNSNTQGDEPSIPETISTTPQQPSTLLASSTTIQPDNDRTPGEQPDNDRTPRVAHNRRMEQLIEYGSSNGPSVPLLGLLSNKEE